MVNGEKMSDSESSSLQYTVDFSSVEKYGVP